jgi:hypothetical protein
VAGDGVVWSLKILESEGLSLKMLEPRDVGI